MPHGPVTYIPRPVLFWNAGDLERKLGEWGVLSMETIIGRFLTPLNSSGTTFAAKVTDVVGLYLHPPEHAMVLSVDEKTSIQAYRGPYRVAGRHARATTGFARRSWRSTST